MRWGQLLERGRTLYINPLSKDKSLDMTKLKAYDKLKVAKLMIFLFDRVENTGKRRTCWYPAFSPFSKVFSIASLFRVFKSQD